MYAVGEVGCGSVCMEGGIVFSVINVLQLLWYIDVKFIDSVSVQEYSK